MEGFVADESEAVEVLDDVLREHRFPPLNLLFKVLPLNPLISADAFKESPHPSSTEQWQIIVLGLDHFRVDRRLRNRPMLLTQAHTSCKHSGRSSAPAATICRGYLSEWHRPNDLSNSRLPFPSLRSGLAHCVRSQARSPLRLHLRDFLGDPASFALRNKTGGVPRLGRKLRYAPAMRLDCGTPISRPLDGRSPTIQPSSTVGHCQSSGGSIRGSDPDREWPR